MNTTAINPSISSDSKNRAAIFFFLVASSSVVKSQFCLDKCYLDARRTEI